MIYRLTVAGIVIFWALMAALLIRMESSPGEEKSMPVPVSFVMKLMFHHEQPADLVLYSQRRKLDGACHLQPRHQPNGADGRSAPLNLINGSGSFALNLPGTNGQRVLLHGVVELDEHEQFQRIDLTASLHEMHQTGPGLTLFLEGSPAQDVWHYEIRQAGMTVNKDTGPVAKLLSALDPHLPGLDFRALEQFQRQQAASSRITASRGILRANGEEVDSYVINFRHGDTLESSIYFSQLGQILAVKTFAGYDLYDEGLTP